MRKPYYKPITQVFPDITLPEPFLSKSTLFSISLLAKIYVRFVLGVSRIELKQSERLIDSFSRTLSGKTSTIIAFRHPYGDEPQILSWLAIYRLTKIAKKSGVRFPINAHIAFVHGYEVPRWSGSFVRWLLPRILAMPIYHAKMDSAGMARIYRAIENGPYPVGIAPEGQVTYNSESIQRLEQGIIRIGFQSAANLERRENSKHVEILPLSIHFRYGKNIKSKLDKMMNKIEHVTCYNKSISSKKNLDTKNDVTIFQKYEMIRNNLIRMNEVLYNIPEDTNRSFQERKEAVITAALNRAEKILEIEKINGDVMTRVNYIRQIYWDRIYLPGKDKNVLRNMPLAERALADRLAGEAWYASRHMELVDVLYYFHDDLPSENTSFHMLIEYVQNLWDFTSRTMGGTFTNRVKINPKTVIIHTGEPIDLTSNLTAYRENRKECIAHMIEKLKENFIQCIDEVKNDDNDDNDVCAKSSKH
jgi:hypothetical protein